MEHRQRWPKESGGGHSMSLPGEFRRHLTKRDDRKKREEPKEDAHQWRLAVPQDQDRTDRHVDGVHRHISEQNGHQKPTGISKQPFHGGRNQTATATDRGPVVGAKPKKDRFRCRKKATHHKEWEKRDEQ